MATAVKRSGAAAVSGASAVALRLLGVMVGLFFLSMGLNKLAWFGDSSILMKKFDIFLKGAPPATQWYIETVASPGVPLFARIVPIAELSTAAALMFGCWVRLAASLAFVMVLNFHLATGELFTKEFLLDGAGFPLLGALLALAIAGSKLPWTIAS